MFVFAMILNRPERDFCLQERKVMGGLTCSFSRICISGVNNRIELVDFIRKNSGMDMVGNCLTKKRKRVMVVVVHFLFFSNMTEFYVENPLR